MRDVDELAIRLVTDCGFLSEFWEQVRLRPDVQHREIFEELNDHYEAAFGEPKWNSYEAFKKFRARKGQTCNI